MWGNDQSQIIVHLFPTSHFVLYWKRLDDYIGETTKLTKKIVHCWPCFPECSSDTWGETRVVNNVEECWIRKKDDFFIADFLGLSNITNYTYAL